MEELDHFALWILCVFRTPWLMLRPSVYLCPALPLYCPLYCPLILSSWFLKSNTDRRSAFHRNGKKSWPVISVQRKYLCSSVPVVVNKDSRDPFCSSMFALRDPLTELTDTCRVHINSKKGLQDQWTGTSVYACCQCFCLQMILSTCSDTDIVTLKKELELYAIRNPQGAEERRITWLPACTL